MTVRHHFETEGDANRLSRQADLHRRCIRRIHQHHEPIMSTPTYVVESKGR